jgi:hypothetical protein
MRFPLCQLHDGEYDMREINGRIGVEEMLTHVKATGWRIVTL